MTGDTIVAPATPPGGGLLALVRVSGPRAVELAAGRPGACVFLAPRSYTREDVVELVLPGAPSLVDRLVRELCAAGCRPARPGEFTLRAFLNGRLDLAQAEAVGRLVAAEDESERRAALRQLGGGFSKRLAELEAGLLDLAADVEASLDFADEDIQILPPDAAADRAAALLAGLRALSAETAARETRDGRPVVVLLGRPNAGKSTLFNALAGADAITSPVAGTTRDAIAADCDLGLPVRLVDLAGVPEAEAEAADAVDVEAARRARAAAASADLAILVADGTEPAAGLEPRGVPCVRVRSKSDLGGWGPGIAVSALTGAGLGELRRAVAAALRSGGGGAHLVSLRQKALLSEAESALARAPFAAGAGMELAALELRSALLSLAGISGRDAGEELLDRVFSRFCLGK